MLRRTIGCALGVSAVIGSATFLGGLSSDNNGFNKFNPFAAISVPASPGPQMLPNSVAKWDHNWDGRDPESLIKGSKLLEKADEKTKDELIQKATPKATRHIILIRHGQYRLCGDDDDKRELTELGREQAVLTGVHLRDAGTDLASLVVSSMTRAQETAHLICQSLPKSLSLSMETDPMLKEVNIPCAPQPSSSSLDYWKPEEKEFLTNRSDDDGKRIEAAFHKYIHRAEPEQQNDSHQVLVCHGNVIKYFVCRALQFPPEGWIRLQAANCSLTWLMIKPCGRVILKSFGDLGHLPPDKVTFKYVF